MELPVSSDCRFEGRCRGAANPLVEKCPHHVARDDDAPGAVDRSELANGVKHRHVQHAVICEVEVLRAIDSEVPHRSRQRQCLEVVLPPLAEPVARRFVVGLQDQPRNLQAATADLAEDGPVEIDRGATSGVTRAEGPRPGSGARTGGVMPMSAAPSIELLRTALLSWIRTLAGALTLLAASAHVFGRYGGVVAELAFAVGYQIHTAISRGRPSL